MATLAQIKNQFTDSNGNPLSGGKVYTYAPGTTTPKATYTDSTGVTPNANPVILDARGEAAIWMTGAYKVVLQDSAGVTIYTMDNVNNLDNLVASGSLTVGTTVTAGGVGTFGGVTSTGAINEYAGAAIIANATTTPIWDVANGNLVSLTGAAVTFTAFPAAPQAGAKREILMNAAHSITAGANMLIDGIESGRTILLAAGDTVEVMALTTTQFRLKVNYAGAIPAFSAYMTNGSANQAVTSGVNTKVKIDTEEFDSNANYDPVTNFRFTPTRPGYYCVNGVVQASGTSPSLAEAFIYKNGAQVAGGGHGGTGVYGYATVQWRGYMNGSTDFVELYGLCTATSPVFIFGASSCRFSATLERR